jgi:hypothetical protein
MEAKRIIYASQSRSHQREYFLMVKTMTPERKLKIAFEMSDRAKQLFSPQFRKEYPDMSKEELDRLHAMWLEERGF